MLKSTLLKISEKEYLKDNKVLKFILELDSEGFGIDENSTYLEKKYALISEEFKDED